MKYDDLRKIWYEEETRAFQGWDFSCLASRWWEEALPWDYKGIIKTYLQASHQLLDMGTGGGEFLLTLGHPWEKTAVTEGWQPNIELCQRQLVPLGITLYSVAGDSRLPIADNRFHLIINRQEDYDLAEVARVLKPGGYFITQQVGGDNCLDLAKRLNPLGEPLYQEKTLEKELAKFRENGFTIIESGQSYPELRFYDIGALVFWARIIQWTFPGFSVENNFLQLCALAEELEEKGYISTRQHRFLLVGKLAAGE